MKRTQLRRTPMKRRKRRPKPGDDPKYLQWIRERPCVCCGYPAPSEAAHFGPRSIGLKPPDRQTLPLCASCHRTGPKAHHVLGSDALFADAHGLYIHAMMANLSESYERIHDA